MNSQTRRVPPPISNYLCVETHNYDERRVGLERPPRASFARWSARRRPAPSVVTYDWRSDSFDLVACLATLDRRRVCTAWANRSILDERAQVKCSVYAFCAAQSHDETCGLCLPMARPEHFKETTRRSASAWARLLQTLHGDSDRKPCGL